MREVSGQQVFIRSCCLRAVGFGGPLDAKDCAGLASIFAAVPMSFAGGPQLDAAGFRRN